MNWAMNRDINLDKIDALYKKLTGGNIADFDGSQNRKEFLDCLCFLNQRISGAPSPEISFLEIGAYKGLWAIAFKLLCEAHHKQPSYTTVTWLAHNPENQSLLEVQRYYERDGAFFNLIDGNSADPAIIAQASEAAPYRFVFIDGDHAYKAVLSDIRHYLPLAEQAVIFHDINTKKCGVRKAVKKSKLKLNIEISHADIMGIGIHEMGSSPDCQRS